MNNTIQHINDLAIIDSLNVNDSVTSFCCNVQSVDNQYGNFKFISEKSHDFEGPKEREISFIGQNWNFVIIFVALILITINKLMNRAEVEKPTRENHSLNEISFFLIIISFILLISMFIHNMLMVYDYKFLKLESFGFYANIVSCTALYFIFNYFSMMFFGWLLNSKNLPSYYLSLNYYILTICNPLLIFILMPILFYPSRLLCVVTIATIVIFYLIKVLKLLKEVRLSSKINFVNIFLYLCTFEIVPILVISKLLIDIV